MKMSVQHQQPQESKPPVCETHSINLSALVKQHIASLPNPEGWRVLAIDSLNDMVVLIREVKTQQ
jgi:hypothetical protein